MVVVLNRAQRHFIGSRLESFVPQTGVQSSRDFEVVLTIFSSGPYGSGSLAVTVEIRQECTYDFPDPRLKKACACAVKALAERSIKSDGSVP